MAGSEGGYCNADTDVEDEQFQDVDRVDHFRGAEAVVGPVGRHGPQTLAEW